MTPQLIAWEDVPEGHDVWWRWVGATKWAHGRRQCQYVIPTNGEPGSYTPTECRMEFARAEQQPGAHAQEAADWRLAFTASNEQVGKLDADLALPDDPRDAKLRAFAGGETPTAYRLRYNSTQPGWDILPVRGTTADGSAAPVAYANKEAQAEKIAALLTFADSMTPEKLAALNALVRSAKQMAETPPMLTERAQMWAEIAASVEKLATPSEP